MQKRNVQKRNMMLLAMASPAILFFIAFNYLPMFGVVLAFKDFNYRRGFIGSDWVGLENFKFLFKGDAWIITRNTLSYNLLFIALGIVIPVTIAIVLHEIQGKYRTKFFQTVLVMPHFLSWIVAGYVFYAFLRVDLGMFNVLLRNLDFKTVNWYVEAKYWPWIIVLAQVWKTSGYASVIYLSALTGISREYYEAAALDGAGKWKQTLYITLPSLKPIVIILTIMAVGRIFYSDFGLFYNVPRQSGILYPVTNVIDVYVFNALRNTGNIGMSAAAAFYQSVIGFILIVSANYIVKKIDSEKALF